MEPDNDRQFAQHYFKVGRLQDCTAGVRKDATPPRYRESPLNPKAPQFVSSAPKPKQDISREHFTTLINNTEDRRRQTLAAFKATNAALDDSKARLLQLEGLPNSEQHREEYDAMRYEIREIKDAWSRLGGEYKALGEEIEDLWRDWVVAGDS